MMVAGLKILDIKSKIALGESGMFEFLCDIQLGDGPVETKHLILSEAELISVAKSLKNKSE